MHLTALAHPITKLTPCPTKKASILRGQAIPSDQPPPIDHLIFDDAGPLDSMPSSSPPPSRHPEASASSAPRSSHSELLSTLPIFSLVPKQHVSLRDLIPLLQSSLLSIVNNNIHSHNETINTILRALGHPTVLHRLVFTSPYDTTTSSAPSTAPRSRHNHFYEPAADDFITSVALSEALAGISTSALASDTAFVAVAELVSDIATSSRVARSTEPPLSEPKDAPIASIAPSSFRPEPIFTSSEIISVATAFDSVPPLAVDMHADPDSNIEEILAGQIQTVREFISVASVYH